MSNEDITPDSNPGPETLGSGSFAFELWMSIRPYILCLIKDWLIALMLWGLLWLFKKITNVVQIDGWPGEFIVNLHAAGTVMAFALFIGLLLWDIFNLHRTRE